MGRAGIGGLDFCCSGWGLDSVRTWNLSRSSVRSDLVLNSWILNSFFNNNHNHFCLEFFILHSERLDRVRLRRKKLNSLYQSVLSFFFKKNRQFQLTYIQYNHFVIFLVVLYYYCYDYYYQREYFKELDEKAYLHL